MRRWRLLPGLAYHLVVVVGCCYWTPDRCAADTDTPMEILKKAASPPVERACAKCGKRGEAFEREMPVREREEIQEVLPEVKFKSSQGVGSTPWSSLHALLELSNSIAL